MVRHLEAYDPSFRVPQTDYYEDEQHTSIQVAVRIVQRNGDPVVEFGEFTDLISYSDTLAVGTFGNFSLTMRVNLTNESLLKKLHPGLILEFYAARNDDPLRGLSQEDREAGLRPLTGADNPPVFLDDSANAANCNCGRTNDDFPQDHQAHSVLNFNDRYTPRPSGIDYLDGARYLILRGIITHYGRSSSVSGGRAETSLIVSGEGYGKIYRDAIVHYNQFGPNVWAKTTPHQFALARVDRGMFLYYGLLRHWVEEFWNDSTGWEARSRPMLYPPWAYARFGSGGQVWGLINALNVPEMIALFVDHTGAICWSKQPWSSKDSAIVDKHLTWADKNLLTNWEDLALFNLPSWKIISWSDRLTDDQVANFVRVQKTVYAGIGGLNMAELPSEAYNFGSIQQYGGPRIRQIEFPWGTRPDNADMARATENERSRLNIVADAIAEEYLGWVDRPVQRVAVQVRGEPYWRIHCRVKLTEDWHSPNAKPGEYYIAGRSHQISFTRSGWVTQLDLIRDRRERYLGLGVENDDIPWVEADDVRMFDRGSNAFVRVT